MSHKLEIEIQDVRSFLEEINNPVTKYDSQAVLINGLLWSAQARIEKPSPKNKTLDTTKKYLSCSIHCICRNNARKSLSERFEFTYNNAIGRNPHTENRNWSCKAAFKFGLIKLNALDQEYKSIVNGAPTTFNQGTGSGLYWCVIPAEGLLMSPDNVKDNKAVMRIDVTPETPTGLHLDQKQKLSEDAVVTQRSRMLSAFRRMTACNVTLLTKAGKSITAHRDILVTGSPVFAAMFESDMQEAMSGQVHLPDMTSECVNRILEYIYGAPLSDLDNVPLSLVQELIYAAEKYKLGELKDYCGTLLVERLASENMLQAYKMTKKYRLDDGVKKEVEEFIIKHIPDVLDQVLPLLPDDEH